MSKNKFRTTMATALSVALATSAMGTPAFAADELSNGEGSAAESQIAAPENIEGENTDVAPEGDYPVATLSLEDEAAGDGDASVEDSVDQTDDASDQGVVANDQANTEQPDDSNYGLSGIGAEDYENKQFIEKVNDGNPQSGFDGSFHEYVFVNENNEEEVMYYPVANRNQRQFDILPSSIQALYEFDEALGLYVPKIADNQWNDPEAGYDWDVIFSNFAEYNMSGNVFINRGESQKRQGTSLVCLHDKTGKLVYAYCMDAEKGAAPGAMYSIDNVISADHIPGDEAQQKLAFDYIRAAARLGYWGAESGIGSLSQMKTELKAALLAGMPVDFTFMGRENGVNDVKPITLTSEKNLNELLAMVDQITEGEALNATQAAIWEYGNHKSETVDNITLGVIRTYTTLDGEHHVFNGDEWLGTQAEYDEYNCGIEARMELIRAYLTSDYAKNLVAAANEGTTIITNDIFLAEDGIDLAVGDKVAGLAANMDDNPDNDVFSTDLSFKLIASPTEEDELLVSLIDANGIVVRQAYIGKNAASNGDDFVYENGAFTFKGLQLAENAQLAFNLKIEGVQYLEQGIYMFKSTKGSEDEQALISVVQGGTDIEAGSEAFIVSFDVNDPVVPEDDPGMGPDGDDDPFSGDDPEEGQEPGTTPGTENDPATGTITNVAADAPNAATETAEASETPDTRDASIGFVQMTALLAGAAFALALRSRKRRA